MIKEWIAKRFCMHQWKEIKEICVYDDRVKGKRPVLRKYLYCCKKCGELKQVNL